MSEGTQRWMFAAFALAFLIKMPSFPFHGWMPDAYRTMPLPALALFSGVLSKVAAYGFLRVALPVFPDAAEDFQTAIAQQVPLQRVGQPDDVAGVIAFLCSDDASYVSGQVIYVRGGP